MLENTTEGQQNNESTKKNYDEERKDEESNKIQGQSESADCKSYDLLWVNIELDLQSIAHEKEAFKPLKDSTNNNLTIQ